MKSVFADTSFLIACFVPSDLFHDPALSLMRTLRGPIVTTEWVLAELANYLAASKARARVPMFLRRLRADKRFENAPATSETFWRAVGLYADRPDQEWGLVDCISFQIMQERQISEAITCDHHFQQAGFRALLRESPQ